MTLILIACILFQTTIAIYLFNINRVGNFEHNLKKLLVLILIHLSTKLFVLTVLNSTFLYNKVGSGFGFAYGPLLYIVFRSFVGRPLDRKSILIHLTPFFVASAFYIFIIIGLTQAFLKESDVIKWVNVYQWFIMISLTAYPMSIIILLKKKKDLQYPESARQLIVNIAYILIAGALTGEVLALTNLAFFKDPAFDIRLLPYAWFSIVPVIILRYKFLDRDLSMNKPVVAVQEDIEIKLEKRYEKSSLDESRLDEYEHTLVDFMEQSRIYLDTELSLDELSAQIQIPKHHLTQLLNERFKKNFYQFINGYRIQEALGKIEKNQENLNLLELAYNCGFNSKSSFNTYFKKLIGCTPSDYRRKYFDNNNLIIR